MLFASRTDSRHTKRQFSRRVQTFQDVVPMRICSKSFSQRFGLMARGIGHFWQIAEQTYRTRTRLGKSGGRTYCGCVPTVLTAPCPTLRKTGRKGPYFNGTLAILADKACFLQICFSADVVFVATKRFSAGNSTVAPDDLLAVATGAPQLPLHLSGSLGVGGSGSWV